MLLATLVQGSSEIAATRSRRAKTEVVARLLSEAEPDELEVVASYLAGVPRQRRTGLGWRGLADLPTPAAAPSLTVIEVDGALEAISRVAGSGSRATRATLVEGLFGRATVGEQTFLRALVFENLRQGAQDSILLDGIAKAAGVPAAAVRRAAMFTPASGEVARAALDGGREALDAFGLVPGRPVRPMLAASAPDVATAVAGMDGPCLVDRKLDGIRVQVHRVGSEVRVYTRSLDDVTERLPEVVEGALTLGGDPVVLDGEVIALRPDGRPRPFQETASRTGSTLSVAELRARTPLTVFFFDLLHVNGTDLLDAPVSERLAALTAAVPPYLQVPRVVTGSPSTAQEFFEESVAAGHEGVVVKALASPYEAGRRGAGWVKVKPRHTLDLVVLAVEWGSGRRQGLLSNIHLGARNGDGFTMLGKTFKGMTDEMLAWQTERFLTLETGREGHVVHVRPEQVVEVAFDGLQTSSRYPGGVALRFARVLRYRDDKTAEEADTLETVLALRGS
ncbi:MAG TPA: ATP-dependent DNA ligase [Marmoricola sp.]|nr:ATP-dependent DNA ligase [Marmoricola sp.]